ncbi:branched-chain amino acid ABC transporter permease [Halobaculum gomorrense]|uniref:Amino acid/amide ABC transporter membrane protein 2, HAAT family n=1 Tax=Halobaculum gomorrense TaxID=43928 RepID=A0A1M5UXK6_9EURY|nr:branched-chain amino acid ABC transporter permease [Halobaculum gomorrense]SHH67578.1 amino acid/amide ABC transporter membrane protein 2, HAAT family [Halobaculum gomorrense]
MSDDADAVTDGGAVAESESAAASGGSGLASLRERDDFVVIATAAVLVVFPFLLIDVFGAIGDLTGFSIGGYSGLPSLVLIYGIVVIGFNLLLGYTGLLSFGHAAFFGSAAYSAALFSQVVPSPLLMVVVGTLVATLLAWPIGFVSIRRSGVYFAVLTLTFGQALYFYALGPGAWLTNGDNGFSDIAAHGLFFGAIPLEAPLTPLYALNSYTVIYAFTAVMMLIAVWVANRIINSPYGLIFEALGENEERVEFVGLNVFRYKLMAFIISAVFAGVGGTMFVIHEQYIHPTTGLYWIQSGDFVIMTVLGGTGSLVGPVLGAFIFEYVANVISGVSLPGIGPIGSLWRFVLGAVFVFIVWVFPRGVYGAAEDLIGLVTGGGGGDDGSEPAATDGGEAE